MNATARRAVREQVGEDAENLRARRGSRLRLVDGIERVGDDGVDVALPLATPLRDAKSRAQRRHPCLDRGVAHPLRAARVDVAPDGSRILEQGDPEVVAEDAD